MNRNSKQQNEDIYFARVPLIIGVEEIEYVRKCKKFKKTHCAGSCHLVA
jgi:hypothetical protein